MKTTMTSTGLLIGLIWLSPFFTIWSFENIRQSGAFSFIQNDIEIQNIQLGMSKHEIRDVLGEPDMTFNSNAHLYSKFKFSGFNIMARNTLEIRFTRDTVVGLNWIYMDQIRLISGDFF